VLPRSTDEFQSLVRDMILERDNLRKHADESVEAAQQELEKREASYRRHANIAAEHADTDDESFDDDPIVETLLAAKRSVRVAKAKLEEAERFASSRENAWERLSGIIDETRNLAAAWD